MPESLTTAELLVPGIILGGAGFVFLVLMLIAVAQWIRVAGARRWPVARGTVLESRVCESSDSDGGWFYRPVITYEYRVGRQVYAGNLLAFGLRSLSEGGVAGEKKAHEAVARYPAGSNVEVRYHPKRPAQSVLEVRSAITKLLITLGAIILFMGAFVAAIILIGNVASHETGQNSSTLAPNGEELRRGLTTAIDRTRPQAALHPLDGLLTGDAERSALAVIAGGDICA